MHNLNKILLSAVLALLVTFCCYRIYFKYDLELSMEARSMGNPAPVSILYNSPKKPNQWPTLQPATGPTLVSSEFQLLTFHIPARKINVIHVLLGHGACSMELRNIQFSKSKIPLTVKDFWTPTPPPEKIIEREDGIITIHPLSAEQPRVRLAGSNLAIKGTSKIEWISALSILAASFFIVFDLLTLLKKGKEQIPLSTLPSPTRASLWRKWRIRLLFWCVIALLGYIFYTVTSYSWTGCDEYWSAACGYEHKIAFKEPWDAYVKAYINWNQRLGNCIQFFVITAGKPYFDLLNPFFLLLSIIAIIKLAAGRIGIDSRTIILILFTFALLVCGVPSPKQTLFLACPTCIYTWVAVCWLLYLSMMINSSPLSSNNAQSNLVRTLVTTGAFLIGFCSGMSNECVIGALLLFTGAFVLIKRKTIRLFQWAAIAGFIAGLIVFFAAPALSARAASNATVPVNLTNIPYLDRLEYWPMLMHDLFFYTKFTWSALIGLGSIVLLLAIFKRKERVKILKRIATSLGFLGGAVIMSSTYLAGAVPYNFAHLPSALLLICACVVMMETIYSQMRSGKWIGLCVVCFVLLHASRNIVDAVAFGQKTQNYRIAREEIISKARKENSIPILEELPFTNQDNPYIWIEDFKDPSVKKQAAAYYKVKDIKLVNDPSKDP